MSEIGIVQTAQNEMYMGKKQMKKSYQDVKTFIPEHHKAELSV